MGKLVLVARVLLGLMFFAAGLVGLLNLMHPEPLPGDAGLLATILQTHGWMTFVEVLDIIAGLLLLVGRFVPLGLVILAPILVNILLFHSLLAPSGIVPGVLATVLEIILIWAYRRNFIALFEAAPPVGF